MNRRQIAELAADMCNAETRHLPEQFLEMVASALDMEKGSERQRLSLSAATRLRQVFWAMLNAFDFAEFDERPARIAVSAKGGEA